MTRRTVRYGLALLLLAPVFAWAQESATTRQLEGEIAEHQQLLEERRLELQRIERELGDTSAQLQARLAERDRIGRELLALRQEQAALQEEIARLEEQLEETQSRVSELDVKLAELKSSLQSLLLNLYKQRAGRFARILAETDSFHELQVKRYYLALLTEQDVALLTELDTTVQQLASEQERLTAQVHERNLKHQELLATQQELEATETRLNQVIAELDATREGQLAQRLAGLRAQEELEQTIAGARQALNAEIERLRREAEEARRRAAAAAVAEQERQRLLEQARQAEQAADALAAPLPAAEAAFILPFPGATLASRYGEGGNNSISLQATRDYFAVQAVKSGIVLSVQLLQANTGYVVLIAHGTDQLTVYQNLQPPIVKVGDRVKQGEVIGYLGGGALIPADILRFYVGVQQANGTVAYIDPAPLLGLP